MDQIELNEGLNIYHYVYQHDQPNINEVNGSVTDVAGAVCERLQYELVWERTANITGKPGANVGLDYANELLNNDFKGMLVHFL